MFKKVILCCLLLVLAFSLRTESAHEQQRRPPQNQPVSNNKPGFAPTPGDPYGQDKQTKATCFSAPCYVPNWRCNGCWKTVIFAVHASNGQLAKFVGYDCGRC